MNCPLRFQTKTIIKDRQQTNKNNDDLCVSWFFSNNVNNEENKSNNEEINEKINQQLMCPLKLAQ